MRRAGSACLVMVAMAATAAAQSGDKAAAAAAFDKGRELMKAAQYAEACKQFETSQRLDPQLGTLYNLGLCHEKLGRLASAWAELDEVAAKDAAGKRKSEAARHAAELAPQRTFMLVQVGYPVDGLVIARGDTDVTALVGVATPVDPGPYTFAATAPGHVRWSAEVVLEGQGKTVVIDVPALAEVRVAQPVDLVRAPAHGHTGRGRRILGGALAGSGLAAVGVGLYFGARARSLTGDARDLCGGALDPCLRNLDAAADDIDRARDSATVSTILVGAGAAVIVGGAVVWLTAPHARAAVVPAVDGDGASLSIWSEF